MLIRLFAGFLIVIGFAGFTLPFWIRSTAKMPADIELPLVEVEDVAVTDAGELIFALTSAGHIQKYTSSGAFIGSYPVDFWGGAFCLAMSGDHVMVYVARRHGMDELDLNGQVLRKDVVITDEQYRAACHCDEHVRSIAQSFGGLVVTFNDGKPQLSIARRPWHYLAFGPLGSWLVLVLGLLLFPEWRRGVLRQIREYRRK
jgi:hypothetical protein